MKDVFDGSHYQSLLNTIVPGEEDNPFFYFSDERDIALGLSTDGFTPFKKRDKTCWPIILFNYNLPPEIRFQKKYCIHVATVPGPKKPWDWDSFCWPLIQELLQLEQGIKAFDAISQRLFLLHAYLILAFGDIPAMALIMRMRAKMVFGLVEFATLKLFASTLVRTMYPCDETRFLELHPLDTPHLISPSALMRD